MKELTYNQRLMALERKVKVLEDKNVILHNMLKAENREINDLLRDALVNKKNGY